MVMGAALSDDVAHDVAPRAMGGALMGRTLGGMGGGTAVTGGHFPFVPGHVTSWETSAPPRAQVVRDCAAIFSLPQWRGGALVAMTTVKYGVK